MIKISKIFGDFVPREFSVGQGLLQTSRHFENRRGEGPGDEVGRHFYLQGRERLEPWNLEVGNELKPSPTSPIVQI